jgi:hypothetical protein
MHQPKIKMSILFVQWTGSIRRYYGPAKKSLYYSISQSIKSWKSVSALAIVKLACDHSYWSYRYCGLERPDPLSRNYWTAHSFILGAFESYKPLRNVCRKRGSALEESEGHCGMVLVANLTGRSSYPENV